MNRTHLRITVVLRSLMCTALDRTNTGIVASNLTQGIMRALLQQERQI
jgi:hypothetical protein